MVLRTLHVFKYGGLRLRLLRGNIAFWQGDCLVNAGNTQLVPSTLTEYWRHIGREDVNTAIYAAAGPDLADECASLPCAMVNDSKTDLVACAPDSGVEIRCPRGEARLTLGHLLKVKHIIHAVGPDYDTSVRCAGGGEAMAHAHEKAKSLLDSTYSNIFRLANQIDVASLALPAISCGVMGFGGHDSVNDAATVSINSCLRYAGSVQSIDFVLKEETTIAAWVDAAKRDMETAACSRTF